LANIIVGVALVLLSVVLVWRHVRQWRGLDKAQLDQPALRYFRRMFQRRTMTSTVIGIIGASMAMIHWLQCSPLLFTVVVIVWLLLLGWILLFALIDLLSTRLFLDDLRTSQRVHRDQLVAEMKRAAEQFRAGDDDGRPPKPSDDDG
jgi:hypothetical protein